MAQASFSFACAFTHTHTHTEETPRLQNHSRPAASWSAVVTQPDTERPGAAYLAEALARLLLQVPGLLAGLQALGEDSKGE